MKTALLYIRVSTDEQADRGFSQRDQDERLRQYCERNEIRIIKVVFEDYSAKTFNRPEWGKLLIELKKSKGRKCDYVLFTKWDRFSRNTADAYGMIRTLMDMDVQPMAIEQPLDHAVPESKIMLAVYLSTPEVENDRRALNVKYGMRRGKKEGRWMGKALPGYINRTREDGRKYIAVNEPEASHMIWAFERIAENIYATENIWDMARKRGLKCAKNSFWDAIRNPCYCGKVIVPKFKEEEMFLAQGLHQPLISENLFFDVQDVLTGRKKELAVRAGCPEELPLRGFLYCPVCSRILTGSASKGRSGYYFYYHCKASCRIRYKADYVNSSFEKELEKLVPKKGISELYKEVVCDTFGDDKAFYQEERKKFITQITEQNNRITKLREMLLTDAIDAVDYKEIKIECENKISRLEAKLNEFSKQNKSEKEIELIVNKAVANLSNLIYLYKESDVVGKKYIIGSIFSEKWVFDGSQHRTAFVNEAASLIYQISSGLQHKKTGVKTSKSSYSGKVPSAGVEPARFPTGV
jgi:site-specific DNA recombinase